MVGKEIVKERKKMETVKAKSNYEEQMWAENQLNEAVKKYRAALDKKDFVVMANFAARYILEVSNNLGGYRYHIEHFGVCPRCFHTDGCLHVGRDEWFVCHNCKVKWLIGSNLFSAWREMTDEEFEKNAELLNSYAEIEAISCIEGPMPKSSTGIRQVVTTVEGPARRF